jgi:hypothetical protein
LILTGKWYPLFKKHVFLQSSPFMIKYKINVWWKKADVSRLRGENAFFLATSVKKQVEKKGKERSI